MVDKSEKDGIVEWKHWKVRLGNSKNQYPWGFQTAEGRKYDGLQIRNP